MSWVNNQNYQKKIKKFMQERPEFKRDDPFYVYSAPYLKNRVLIAQKHLKDIQNFYAMKANNHPQLLKLMAGLGLGVDTVSTGEIRLALSCGFSAEKIIYSGVAKSEKDIVYVTQLGIKQVNVESLPELERIAKVTQRLNQPLKVGLRINPDVSVDTHPYIATGLKENKFGLETQQIAEAIQIIKQNSLVQFQGLSLHIGSLIKDLSAYEEAFKITVDLIAKLRQQGLSMTTIDVGGGIGILYDQDDELGEENLFAAWANLTRKYFGSLGFEILAEHGRWFVAHSGVLMGRVEYVKKGQHKNFLILNTGMHHLLRPALYQAQHRILPFELSSNPKEVFDIVGPICESSDVLLKQSVLPAPEEGDWMVIYDTGAYGAVMASDYNLHAWPDEYWLED